MKTLRIPIVWKLKFSFLTINCSENGRDDDVWQQWQKFWCCLVSLQSLFPRLRSNVLLWEPCAGHQLDQLEYAVLALGVLMLDRGTDLGTVWRKESSPLQPYQKPLPLLYAMPLDSRSVMTRPTPTSTPCTAASPTPAMKSSMASSSALAQTCQWGQLAGPALLMEQ